MHEGQVSTVSTSNTSSTAQSIYFFSENQVEGDAERKDILGGKGAGLAAMCKAGLPVPPGFTISIDCCKYYHDNNNTWTPGLEDQVKEYLRRLEQACAKKFGEGSNPLLVSVRSGAARSMPGMMDTILNCGLHMGLADQVQDAPLFWSVYIQFIKQFAHTIAEVPLSAFETITKQSGDDTKEAALALIRLYEQESGNSFPQTPWEALRDCINAVFDSWNNERAKIYRASHGLEDLHGTAVNVQSMFNSEISGIAFTANPSKPKANEVVIESAYGLGEAVVSGDVTPDRFILDGDSLAIQERHLGHKAHMLRGFASSSKLSNVDPDASSLTDEQINEVGRIAKKVENHFQFPVDIEWGIENGKISLLQSRAIRGLDVARDQEVGRLEEIERLKAIADGKDKVWVTHNLGETLKYPTPMTWDIMSHFMSGNGGFGKMYKDFGYHPSEEVNEKGFLELICGRIYVDPERAAALFWSSMPLKYDYQEILDTPSILEAAPMKFDAERADGAFLLNLPASMWAMFKSSRQMKREPATALDHFLQNVVPPYLEYLMTKAGQKLGDLSDEQLVKELDERIDRIMTQFGAESLKPGFYGGMARAKLEATLVQLMGEEEGGRLAQQLCSGLDGDSTVEQNQMLFEVAGGKYSLDDFLNKYGHRAVDEMELSKPRFREDQSYLHKNIDMQKRSGDTSPEALHETNKAKRLDITKHLPDTLIQWAGGFLQEEIEETLQQAQSLLPYRETGKHYLMMGYELIRRVLVELGHRHELGGDIFFLKREELSNVDQFKKLIEQRKVRWQSAQRLDMTDVIDIANINELGLPRKLKAKDEYDAVAIAPGSFVGTARIIYSPTEADDLPEDCILVCPSTDPSWTALFTHIKAVVVERGGVLSHGAITARDFGIPAVACHDMCSLIKDGDTLRVDGDKGHITVVGAQHA